jgi:hypothetical protein
MSSDRPIIFKHPRWSVVFGDTFLLLFTTAFIFANIDTFFFYKFSDVITARIVTLAFLFLFCPFLFLGRTFIADIHVDEDGIGWWFWGRRWKYIRWADVKVMTIETIVAYGLAPQPVTLYSFYRTDKTPTFFYPLKFGDDIQHAEALVAAVAQYVQQYNIKVLDRRGETEGRPRLS